MSDWRVGDLAIAVGVDRKDWPRGWFPDVGDVKGKIFRVIGIDYRGATSLLLEGFPSPHSSRTWHSASFRKISPDEREACEPEFVTLLKRSKVPASRTLARRAETTGSVHEWPDGKAGTPK